MGGDKLKKQKKKKQIRPWGSINLFSHERYFLKKNQAMLRGSLLGVGS
jgi:hypothetical protein